MKNSYKATLIYVKSTFLLTALTMTGLFYATATKQKEVVTDVAHSAQEKGHAFKEKASDLVHQGKEKGRELKDQIHHSDNGPVYTFALPANDGGLIDLADYRGMVIMIVNMPAGYDDTAPQLKELEALYEYYAGSGFTVIAVSSDDFSCRMERGIATDEYTIGDIIPTAFPQTDRVHVTDKKGKYEACSLYKWLTGRTFFGIGAVKGDFHKFLIGRDGEFVDWFAPKTSPNEKKVIKSIEKALTL